MFIVSGDDYLDKFMMTTEKWQQYLSGECSPEERKSILLYLEPLTDPELEKILEEGWENDAPSMPVETAHRLDRRLAKLSIPKRSSPLKMIRSWYAAAAILLLSLGGFYMYDLLQQQSAKQIVWKSIKNETRFTKKITLPDNSSVWLMPWSAMELPDNFNEGTRPVRLTGEAYFEVTHNPQQPFTVNTDKLQTNVLGTHFNIESYPDEAAIHVSLTSGKVAIRLEQPTGKDRLVYLSPGHKLSWQKISGKFSTDPLLSLNEEAWKTGIITWDDLPVTDVFRRLQHRFNKQFVFSSHKFSNKRSTASYSKADLKGILTNLSFVQDFTFNIKSDTVFIH